MILPVPMPPGSPAQITDLFFSSGGGLEQHCTGCGIDYEQRPQQQKMARAIADAADAGHHLAVEAGTGVGKSFAYLVPLILTSLQRESRCVIATYTITLQEQLIHKDLPFIRDALGIDFKSVMVKGRSNYICLLRLQRARQISNDLFNPEHTEQLESLQTAIHNREEGDGSLQELKEQPDPQVWGAVCAEYGNCTGKKCRYYSDCYFMNARQSMMDAQVLVVNHSLFFSEMALRSEGAALLPSYGYVVFDEAHQMEAAASSHLGIRLSPYMIEYWLRRISGGERRKGLMAALQDGQGALLATQTADAMELFFERVRTYFRLDAQTAQQSAPKPPEIETDLPEHLTRLCFHLKTVSDSLEDMDMQAEIKSLRTRGLELRDTIEAFLSQSLSGHVYWVETQGRRRLPVLYSAPVDVGPLLREMLFDELPCVVMTSATLAVSQKLEYFRHRIGANEAAELQVGSPFDYARQMRIQIASEMPPPTDPAFEEAACRSLRSLIESSRGRAFVLFTNAALMRRVADALRFELEDEGYQLLVQGSGTPPQRMLEQFKQHEAAVLFGLDRFWMGVDVPGEALSHVIITRLPFAVPDHPLIQARFESIERQGGNPFREYSLPEAVLKFRQGVGRLIRSASDTGTVTILDSRIRHQWYGRLFLESLDTCPVEEVPLPDR